MNRPNALVHMMSQLPRHHNTRPATKSLVIRSPRMLKLWPHRRETAMPQERQVMHRQQEQPLSSLDSVMEAYPWVEVSTQESSAWVRTAPNSPRTFTCTGRPLRQTEQHT